MRLRPLTNTDLKLKRKTFAVSSTAPIINFANLSNSALLGTAFVSRSAGLDFVSTHCNRTSHLLLGLLANQINRTLLW